MKARASASELHAWRTYRRTDRPGHVCRLRALLVGYHGALAQHRQGALDAAVAVRARAREVMLPVLLLPLLIGGVKSTQAVLSGGSVRDPVGVLAAFDVVFVVAGVLLFEHVVRD